MAQFNGPEVESGSSGPAMSGMKDWSGDPTRPVLTREISEVFDTVAVELPVAK